MVNIECGMCTFSLFRIIVCASVCLPICGGVVTASTVWPNIVFTVVHYMPRGGCANVTPAVRQRGHLSLT